MKIGRGSRPRIDSGRTIGSNTGNKSGGDTGSVKNGFGVVGGQVSNIRMLK